MATKKGLGKGMESLLGTSNANSVKNLKASKEVKENTYELSIDEISPNKNQPRKEFNEDKISELSDSIKQHGIIEPIVVTKKKNSRGQEFYQIVAGERRWRAAKEAGLTKVPTVIKEYTDEQILQIALIENIQREDLNAIEEALALESLVKELKLTQDQLAERISKSRTAITNSMRLLKLSKKVQQMVIEEKISAGHARALLSIDDKNKQYEIAQNIFDQGLSVRETEKLVKKGDSSSKDVASKTKLSASEKARIAAYKEKENEIKSFMKTKVSIEDKGNKGKIIISYNNLEEFERLYDLLVK